MICPRSTPITARGEDGFLYLFLSGCKAWTCHACGVIKRNELLKKIRKARPTRFLTLTVCPLTDETPREAYDRTRRQLSELFKHFKRTKRPAEYVRVIEAHKSGMPHYHLLTRGDHFWPQQEIAEIWYRLTGAYVVDIRRIDRENRGDETAAYVAKYLGKDAAKPLEFTAQKVSASRNFWKKEPPKPKEKRFEGFHRDGKDWPTAVKELARWYHLETVKHGAMYRCEDRQPGDELPEEIREGLKYADAQENW